MYKFDGWPRGFALGTGDLLLRRSGAGLAMLEADISKSVRVGIELVEMLRLVGLLCWRDVIDVWSKALTACVGVMALSAISFIDFCNNYIRLRAKGAYIIKVRVVVFRYG